ncbi:DUF5374 domain-containing protein [Glaesserella sp.]|uniref:DUF5374 domain-containing protein n=1 Tax=Glaesserella sp. TaxID=2094731 RepID=UPI00359F57F3
MTKLFKAESFVGLFIAVMSFGFLYLSYSHWQSWQNRQLNFIFQQQQALLIAENQLTLKMTDKSACEKRIEQNAITFEIQCSSQQIKVRFPSGEVVIKRDS